MKIESQRLSSFSTEEMISLKLCFMCARDRTLHTFQMSAPPFILPTCSEPKGLVRNLQGGGGLETEGGSQLFEPQKREGS